MPLSLLLRLLLAPTLQLALMQELLLQLALKLPLGHT